MKSTLLREELNLQLKCMAFDKKLDPDLKPE